MSDKVAKPLTIRVEKPKSDKALKRERIHQWEDASNKNYDEVAACMFHECITYFQLEKYHFSREVGKLNDIKFRIKLKKSMLTTIDEYIDFISDFSRQKLKEEFE